MHAKYEVAIFSIAKVMSKVKVLGQNDRQTGQKQYTPSSSKKGVKTLPQWGSNGAYSIIILF